MQKNKAWPYIILLIGLGCWTNLSMGQTTPPPENDLNRELIVAVEQGNNKTIKSLIRKGADVNMSVLSSSPFYMFFISRQTYLDGLAKRVQPKPVYISAIHANASRANQKVLEALLKAGGNIDAGDSRGKTPLMYALRQPGGERYALQLLQGGANYTSRDEHGNSTLHYAALGGNLESIRITASGGIDLNARNQDGMTPLHVAVIRSPRKVIQTLLDLGADLEITDNQGFTVLHYAAAFGHQDEVRFLYERSPSLFTENKAGSNPLDIAYAAGNDQVALYFRRKGHNFGDYRYEEMVAAVKDKNAALVLQCLQAGANPNRPTDAYPIHVAAQNEDLASLGHLIKEGANLEQKDAEGKTALALALEAGSATTTHYLLEAGAQPQNRWLPMLAWNMREASVQAEWMPVMRSMATKVKEIDLPGGALEMPSLHYAAYLGLEDLLDHLLKHGANPKGKDKEGWTALHWAVIKRIVTAEVPEKVRIAEKLIEAGCAANTRTQAPKALPHKQPYLARRVPGNATPVDLLDYALPKDSNMMALLDTMGGDTALLAADYYENGIELQAMDLYETAQVEFNKCLKREPEFAGAYFARGQCKQAAGQWESAAIDFDQAIQHRPFYPEAYFQRGKSYFHLKEYETAARDLQKARSEGLRSGELYLWLGRSQIYLGQTEAACQSFSQANGKNHPDAKAALDLYCK